MLEDQMGRLRGQIQPHADAGLHALRHTFLTEAGEGDQAKPCRRLPSRVLEGRTERRRAKIETLPDAGTP